jgi:hypothetical protein
MTGATTAPTTKKMPLSFYKQAQQADVTTYVGSKHKTAISKDIKSLKLLGEDESIEKIIVARKHIKASNQEIGIKAGGSKPKTFPNLHKEFFENTLEKCQIYGKIDGMPAWLDDVIQGAACTSTSSTQRYPFGVMKLLMVLSKIDDISTETARSCYIDINSSAYKSKELSISSAQNLAAILRVIHHAVTSNLHKQQLMKHDL